MHVFLDLWGTVLDGAKMNSRYATRMAEILSSRLGGAADAWTRAHDKVWVWYTERANEIEWDTGDYLEKVQALESEHLDRILSEMGISWRPEDPAAYARDLEFAIMSTVDARLPDARPAIERLRNGGHHVYIVTSATDSNARGSLGGAGLLEAFDRIFTGTTQNLHKSSDAYWRRLLDDVRAPPEACVLVDDRLDYLAPAASAGIVALLLDRKDAHLPESVPGFVDAILRNLAGLPHWVETRSARRTEG